MAFSGAAYELAKRSAAKLQRNRANAAQVANEPFADAEAYRRAVQQATYGALGPEFSQGLRQITGGLAGAGPLADSGAATALRSRLASDIYGRAAGRIGGSYADYLGNVLNQRRQYNYQRQLLAYQKKLNKRSTLGTLGGIAGGIGGALLARAGGGYSAGSNLGGYSPNEKIYGGY